MVSATLGIETELLRGGEVVLVESPGRKVGASVLMALVGTVEALLKREAEVVLDVLCGNVVVLLDDEVPTFLSRKEVFTGCPGRGRSGRRGLVRAVLLGFKGLPGFLIKASAVEVILEVLDACVGVVIMLVVVVTGLGGLGVVVVVATVVGFGSSISGFTTTKEVTGVTKLYFSERLVAFSASKRCANGSVLLSFAIKSSLTV